MVDGVHREPTFQLYKKAVSDIRQLIDIASQRKDLETKMACYRQVIRARLMG